jgi:hypothetical protein
MPVPEKQKVLRSGADECSPRGVKNANRKTQDSQGPYLTSNLITQSSP